MLRHLILVGLTVIVSMSVLGCGDMLNAQAAKDRDLGKMVNENLETGQFRANFVSFSYTGEPGVYKCVTKDLADAKAVGDFGYNVMVVLIERNNTKVKTGRGRFVIKGEQDGDQIFEVSYTIGNSPIVVLKGPYEGEEYIPNVR